MKGYKVAGEEEWATSDRVSWKHLSKEVRNKKKLLSGKKKGSSRALLQHKTLLEVFGIPGKHYDHK